MLFLAMAVMLVLMTLMLVLMLVMLVLMTLMFVLMTMTGAANLCVSARYDVEQLRRDTSLLALANEALWWKKGCAPTTKLLKLLGRGKVCTVGDKYIGCLNLICDLFANDILFDFSWV